jgi:proteasome assembly chaperone (PAC2) family protein
MWERLEVEEEQQGWAAPAEKKEEEEPVMIVALSTMVPQYQALYSHARELAKFLLDKLEFKKIATLYSSTLPPEVVIEASGLMRLHSNQFYTYSGGRRVVLLAGDGSPFDDQQQYAHSILSFARRCGIREVISVGARWSESPVPAGSSLMPVGFATDINGVARLQGLGVTITKNEPGPFFPNLVVAMAEEYGMKGYKLGVDHGEPAPHPRSLIQILDVLSKMLGLTVDLTELMAKAKELEGDASSTFAQDGMPSLPREPTGIYG